MSKLGPANSGVVRVFWHRKAPGKTYLPSLITAEIPRLQRAKLVTNL